MHSGSAVRWLLLLTGILLLFEAGISTVAAAERANEVSSASQVQKAQAVLMPFLIQNQEKGELLVTVSTNIPDILVEAEPLLMELESLVQPETLSRLKEAQNSEGQIKFQFLQDLGFQVAYDTRELLIKIDVPASVRKGSDIRIYPRKPPFDPGKALKPSLFSTFLNIRSGFDYVEQSSSGFNEGLQPVRLDLDGAINLNDWVIEGSGLFTDRPEDPWQRGDVRLVRDDPDRRLRYFLGDLSYPISGFQSYVPMGGFGVAKNFALQPYRVTEPLGRTSFFLKSQSRVEVFVNGRQVQTLQLAPGPHTLRDFFLVNGSNDVMLRITDDVGHVETVRLSFFFDSRLLAQGEHEFSYNVGVPSRSEGSERIYNEELPSYSLFHRFGLTDTVTLGLNSQGNEDVQNAGAEALFATEIGTFHSEANLSMARAARLDYAARVQYVYTDSGLDSSSGNVWSVAVQYLGESFATLANPTPRNNLAVDISTRYSRRLPWGLRAGIGGGYQIRRGNERNSSNVGLFFSKRWRRGIMTDLTLDRDMDERGVEAYRAFVTLSWFFDDTGHSVNASYDSYNRVSRMDWQYNPRYAVGSFGAGMGVQQTDEIYQGLGHLRYTGYRSEIDLSQNVTTPARSGDQVDTRTSMRFGTALVYADGAFGFSRPINDSFAIVAPHESMSKQTIGIDPLEQHYSARADRFGVGVVPNLQSYQVRRVLIDAEDLPAEYQVTEDSYVVRPTYKSGTVVRVGSEPAVIVRGILNYSDGTPVPLQAGEAVPISNSDRKSVTFFTNRQGRFSVDGLAAGTYELRMGEDGKSIVRFEIPKDKLGFFDVGTLVLNAKVPQANLEKNK